MVLVCSIERQVVKQCLDMRKPVKYGFARIGFAVLRNT